MKKRIETSKLILIVSYIVAITLTIIVIYGTFAGVDMSNVTQVTIVAWGEVAASNVFYYNKAAKENVIKIAKALPKEMRDQFDINQMFVN